MNVEVYCDYCKKIRELRLFDRQKGTKIYLFGFCPFCGTYWCKLKGRSDGPEENHTEEWFIDYFKYKKRWEVKSDGKIPNN